MRTLLMTLLFFSLGLLSAQQSGNSIEQSDLDPVVESDTAKEDLLKLNGDGAIGIEAEIMGQILQSLSKSLESSQNSKGDATIDSVVTDLFIAGSKILERVVTEGAAPNSLSDPTLDSTIGDLVDVGSRLMGEMLGEMPEMLEGIEKEVVNQSAITEKLEAENKALKKLLEGSNALHVSVTKDGVEYKGQPIALEKLASEIKHAPSFTIDVDSDVKHAKLIEVLQAVNDAGVQNVSINSKE